MNAYNCSGKHYLSCYLFFSALILNSAGNLHFECWGATAMDGKSQRDMDNYREFRDYMDEKDKLDKEEEVSCNDLH